MARRKNTTPNSEYYEYKGRFSRLSWNYYAPGEKPAAQYTDEELRRIVRKAAKAANQRIRGLEKSGLKSSAYELMKAQAQGKTRFKERTAKQTRGELMSEFTRLREFMTAQTSTVKGVKQHRKNVYNAYVKAGFKGSIEDFEWYIQKYMTTEMTKFYGSDILYQMITENKRESLEDYFNTWVEEQRKEEAGESTDKYARGRALLRMLKRRKG